MLQGAMIGSSTSSCITCCCAVLSLARGGEAALELLQVCHTDGVVSMLILGVQAVAPASYWAVGLAADAVTYVSFVPCGSC